LLLPLRVARPRLRDVPEAEIPGCRYRISRNGPKKRFVDRTVFGGENAGDLMNRYPQFVSAHDLDLLSRVLEKTSTFGATENDRELQAKRILELFESGITKIGEQGVNERAMAEAA
jgi:hypothetical protein